MSELSRNSKYDHVFAIVRVDRFHEPGTDPETAITIKKVVRSRECAEEEVSRLNALNCDKRSVYFWQVTRLERSAEPPELVASAPDSSASKAAPAGSS